MISVIICARTSTLSPAFVENITSTIGVPFEIISIDNSENKYSIFSAYNEGYAKSKYPYLCFIHDDILFHSSDWGAKLIAHLQDQQTGIIGLAGGDMIIRVPSSWSAGVVNINITQSDRTGKKPTKLFRLPHNYDGTRRSAIVLDGVMLAMRRDLMEKIRFDENLGGFHGYDFDISLQATVAGFTNYVVYDINLEHLSRGKPDKNYYKNLIRVYRKWEDHLPLMGRNIPEDMKNNLRAIEFKRFKTLINRMIKTGFTTREIHTELNYNIRFIDSGRAQYLKIFIYFNIFFTRLFTVPGYFLKCQNQNLLN